MLRTIPSIAILALLAACQLEEDTSLGKASLKEDPTQQVLVGRLFFADENDRRKAAEVGSNYEANLAENTGPDDVIYLDLTTSRSASLLTVLFLETLDHPWEGIRGSCKNTKSAIDLISMNLAKSSINHEVRYDTPLGHCVGFRLEDEPAVGIADKDYGEIMEARRRILEQGGCRAAVQTRFNQGEATQEQLQETFELCQREADEGDPGAKYYLAFLYLDPRFGPDEDLAIDLVRQSAADGYATAQWWLGWRSEVGELLPKYIDKAVQWYELAADQGHSLATARLAQAYENGELGLERDSAKAEEFRNRKSCKPKKEEC